MHASRRSLADWLVRLESFSPHAIELGLDRVAAVLDQLALELPPKVLHVAGTNGKGSSVAMARSMLSEIGESVGSYTSPHVLQFNERINVAGCDAADADIVRAFERVDAARQDVPLTYFEYGTLAALVVFETASVDVAILEVGMGGRLDAVNAVEPTAGLITNVSLDHCDWLGDDIETIAAEKAGIMRRGTKIVYASRDVPATVRARAVEVGADLILAGRDYDWQVASDGWAWQGRDARLEQLAQPALPGAFQVANAAGVLALLEAAGYADKLKSQPVSAALRSTFLPGRMQTLEAGNRRWLLDVAHNAASAAALGEALAEDEHTARRVAILSLLEDKDVAGVVAALAPHVDDWIALESDNSRAIPVAELARQVANTANRACLEAPSLAAAIERARAVSTPADQVLVTGSFYLVGPVLEALAIY